MKKIISTMREPVNTLTHFFAAVAGAIGLIVLLVISRQNSSKQISMGVYGISIIFLFTASALYHYSKSSQKVLEILRKLDHSAIYLLIAGTYTPILFNLFEGYWKWGMLIVIWSLAIIGIFVKIFIIKAPRWLNAGIYLFLGWLIIFAINELLRVMPQGALILLLVGGVIYSVGAIIYSTKTFNFLPGKFGFHEVWHIFVILGALAHFLAVAIYIAPGPK